MASCFNDVPWKLYSSRVISAWGDRMWMFAVGLFMANLIKTNDILNIKALTYTFLQVELSPGSLKWPAIYGLTQSLAVVFAGSIIGQWIDRTPRWNGII